uniref:Uncharacterized protein n=1 Tax=Araucaria cunninghamii TaxID=56994 RepID=A0A0D6R2I5_ARACU
MTRSLGGVGAWAEEAEREEAEREEAQKILQQQRQAEAEAAAAVNVSKARRKKNPTYSISEVTTGQYVGHGGRSRALPDVRICPFTDRNTLPDRRAGAGSEQIERKREVVHASRADQVDDWSSGKKASAVYSAGESKSDRRRFPSQDARVVEPSVPSSSQDECEQTEVADRQRQARVRSDPFAGARPREDVLAGKGKHKEREGELDKVKEKETDGDGISAEDKVSGVVEEVVREEKNRVEERPSSSSSTSASRPPIFRGPEAESRGIPQKKKVNPFGEARPREDLLLERGLDWRKIDLALEHRAVDRPESERERKLKEEIRMLENLVKNHKDGDCGTTIERTGQILDKEHVENIRAQLMQKESELQELTLALDDMVRFPQKQVDRPSSRSGHTDHPDKMAVGSEQTDSSKAYNPGRLGTLPLSREITREYDYERLSFSSRDMDISQGVEAAKHGGMIRGYDPSDFRGAGIDRPRSRSGSGDFPGGYDVNRPGVHTRLAGFATPSDSGCTDANPGYNDFYQGNGSEREQFNSGHVNFRRGYIPERLDSRSHRNNIPQGYDMEKSSSGSWHSDEREYGSERSGLGAWHDDEFICESERPRAGSRQGDVR